MSKENPYCVKKEVNINTKCENSGRNVLRQDYKYYGGSIKFIPGWLVPTTSYVLLNIFLSVRA